MNDTGAPMKPERRRVTRSRARPIRKAKLLALVAILAGLTCLPLTLFGISVMNRLYEIYPAKAPGEALAVSMIITACLVVGGLGIWRLRLWGWWLTLVGAVLGVLDLARFFLPLALSIDTEHPRAPEAAISIVIAAGPALAVHCITLLLLALPSIRRAYRVTTEPRVPRRSGAPRPPGAARSPRAHPGSDE